jgi:hypothetical protein
MEKWMRDLAHTGWQSLFHQAPKALHFLIQHQEALPPEIPRQLNAAGLLDDNDGDARPLRYGPGAAHPYGSSVFT